MKLTSTHISRPFGTIIKPTEIEFPVGMSLQQIVDKYHPGHRASVWIPGKNVDWEQIDPKLWARVYPKTDIRVVYEPSGDVKKAIDKVVNFVKKNIIEPIKQVFSGPTISSPQISSQQVIAPAPTLTPVPTTTISSTSTVTPTISASGISSVNQKRGPTAAQFSDVESGQNIVGRNSYLPIVVGTRRVLPPELTVPISSVDRGVEQFNRVFALEGRHELSDVWADGAPVSDLSAITTDIIDGEENGPTESSLATKIANVNGLGETLSKFATVGDDLDVADQDEPSNSEPRPIRFVTAFDSRMEEIRFRVSCSNFVKSTNASVTVVTPVRIRFRPRGSTNEWYYMPEIHFRGKFSGLAAQEIRIRWDESFGESYDGGNVEYRFYQRVPPVDVTDTSGIKDGLTDQWQADNHFIDPSAFASPPVTPGLRDVANISSNRSGLWITLDESIYPKQEYEWEIVRAQCFNSGLIAQNTYAASGTVYNFFRAYATSARWRTVSNQSDFLAEIGIDFALVLIDRTPCARPNTALIGFKARGQTVRNVTVLASRYVNDYDRDAGTWSVERITKNPAAQYRQLLVDFLTHYGVSTSLIDDDRMAEWWIECEERDYEVSALFAGATMRDALESIATAGFAKPGFSDRFTVDYFRDRSSNNPVQVFSPRNSNVSVQWLQPPKPIGLRVSFQDETDSYRDAEVQFNNPHYQTIQAYDIRDYGSITNPELVRRRAMFEMFIDRYQSRRVWSVETSIEGLVCEVGDLVGIITDIVEDFNQGARVSEVISNTILVLDQIFPVQSTTELFSVSNIFNLSDILEEGRQSVVLLSTPTGTELRTIESSDGISTIRVSQAFSTTDLKGAHVAIGPASKFTRRCIVTSIERRSDELASITLVDEAPEIWDNMNQLFPLELNPAVGAFTLSGTDVEMTVTV